MKSQRISELVVGLCPSILLPPCRQKSWNKLADLRETRYWHGSVCLNDVMYVVGGRVSGSDSNSVDFMSVSEQGQWRRGPDLPTATRYPKVSVVSGRVFVLDSYNSSHHLVELDVSGGRWVEREACPFGFGDSVSVCSALDRLWVVGGYDRCCFYYSPATDSWSEAQHQPRLKHWCGSAVVWRQQLMLLGGGCNGGTDESEQMEVAGSGIWSDSHIKLPDGLNDHHAFVLDLPQ